MRHYGILLLVLLGSAYLMAGLPARAQAAPVKPSFLEEECPEEFTLLGQVRGLSGKKSATLFFNYTDAAHTLAVQLSRNQAVVVRRDGGAGQRLASVALPVGRQDSLEFAVKRRRWRVTLICNDRVVAQCYDDSLAGGRAGWQADPGVTMDLRLQATEPVQFADDFTRGPGEAGQWEILAGTGQVAEVAIARHGKDVGRYSSNAFSWTASARPIAMSVAGYWFWDNYAVDVSVKPEGRGAVGIAAYLKDADNFLLFRWTAATEGQPGSGAREILRVEGGKATLLASRPGGFQPRQWYRLRFTACEGVFTASIDGEEVCRVRDAAFGHGRVGLYARDTDRVVFDDVRVVATDAFSDSFDAHEPGKWQNLGMAWKADTRGRARVSGAGEGITITGRPDWSGYAFGADVTPGKAEAVGLVFAYRGPGEYALFRVPASGKGRAVLLRVQGGKPVVVAESPAAVVAPRRSRLKLELHDGQATGFIGNRPVVAGVDPAFGEGKAGFYARGSAGARFEKASAWFPVPEGDEPRIEAQFAREQTMAGWASASSSWSRDPGGSGLFWHTGFFPGDASVSWDLPGGNAPLDLMLALNADGSRAETGYQAVLSVNAQGAARLELRRGGQSVAAQSGRWEPGSPLRVWRSGSLIAAALGDALVAQYQDPQPLTGGRIGLRCSREVNFASVYLSTLHVLDCTFSGPPTEWWAPRGDWDVVQRWPCDERWSFFGSRWGETPVLWTKRSFEGNLVAEAWVALLMDAPEDPKVGYSHPSDLHLTLCGDGKDLSSGYTFQFAADNNSVTRLLRREQVVAENRQVRMINPTRTNLAFQRHWFHLRVEKEGARLRCYVDGKLACDYTDPQPLPGGQVALWTSRNGLMVARARVWAEKPGRRNPLAALPVAPAPPSSASWSLGATSPPALTCDFERGLGGWTAEGGANGPVLSLDRESRAQGKQSLRVTNPISGGSLGALCGIRQFDAVKFPILEFDYRMDPRARVNLYLRVGRQAMVLGLSAAQLAEPSIPSLGAIEGFVADGKWHRARIDLLGALRRFYPTATTILVEDLAVRSPEVEYLRSGFGGNTWGVSYHLDNFRLLGAPETKPEDAKAVVVRE